MILKNLAIFYVKKRDHPLVNFAKPFQLEVRLFFTHCFKDFFQLARSRDRQFGTMQLLEQN